MAGPGFIRGEGGGGGGGWGGGANESHEFVQFAKMFHFSEGARRRLAIPNAKAHITSYKIFAPPPGSVTATYVADIREGNQGTTLDYS